MLNSHYLFIIHLDYIKNIKKELEIKEKLFLEDKKIKIKHIFVPKIE